MSESQTKGIPNRRLLDDRRISKSEYKDTERRIANRRKDTKNVLAESRSH